MNNKNLFTYLPKTKRFMHIQLESGKLWVPLIILDMRLLYLAKNKLQNVSKIEPQFGSQNKHLPNLIPGNPFINLNSF